MAVTIKIPTSLRRFAGGVAVVEVASATVRDALDALDAAHPGIKAKLCDSDGNLRRFINIYADEEDIRFLDHLDTALEDGTELQIVPAIAGGAGETSALTADQRRRYARQLTLDEVGRRGQERLLAARVALDGDGPAAQEAATYLAAAGVGRLEVSPSLHARLAARLGALNPDVTLAVGGSDQVADLRLPPFETDDRLTGSRAALAALVALCTGASGEGEASP